MRHICAEVIFLPLNALLFLLHGMQRSWGGRGVPYGFGTRISSFLTSAQLSTVELRKRMRPERTILVDGVNADVFLCSYLHSCCPPIIHGNLTCDTIFIQHNGLVKIGSGNVQAQPLLSSFKALACRI